MDKNTEETPAKRACFRKVDAYFVKRVTPNQSAANLVASDSNSVNNDFGSVLTQSIHTVTNDNIRVNILEQPNNQVPAPSNHQLLSPSPLPSHYGSPDFRHTSTSSDFFPSSDLRDNSSSPQTSVDSMISKAEKAFIDTKTEFKKYKRMLNYEKNDLKLKNDALQSNKNQNDYLIQVIKEQSKNLTTQQESFMAENKLQQNKLNEYKAQVDLVISKMDRQKVNYDAQIGTLNTELEKMRKQNGDLSSKVTTLNIELDEMKKQNNDLTSKVTTLTNELDGIKKLLNGLTQNPTNQQII